MSVSEPKKRVSKTQWLTRALEVLQAEGLQGVKVDRLARDFGISRAGFYWHFKDRNDLLQQMLEFWAAEFTAIVTQDPELKVGDPAARLKRTMVLILENDLTRYEVAIRDWSMHDKSAARVVKSTYQARVDFVRSLFRELGFRGQQLEMRTRLFVCYPCRSADGQPGNYLDTRSTTSLTRRSALKRMH